MSVDFALLKCSEGFADDVTPIPLADRFPDTNVAVTNYGCPRCEWPSLQVLKVNRAEGQVLSWKPEAIGGRSGSSVIDHTDAGPRVVGRLTWAGGGEGLGQSTPFLLNAMRGQLPANTMCRKSASCLAVFCCAAVERQRSARPVSMPLIHPMRHRWRRSEPISAFTPIGSAFRNRFKPVPCKCNQSTVPAWRHCDCSRFQRGDTWQRPADSAARSGAGIVRGWQRSIE